MGSVLTPQSGQTNSVSGAVTPLYPLVGSDYIFSKDEPGESILSYVGGPLDCPNTIRVSVQPVADVFKASPIDPAVGQRKDGFNYLVQVNEVWRVVDQVTGIVTYLPVSAHMVIKLPTHGLITPEVVADLYTRLIGAIYRGEDAALDDTLRPLLHGVTRLDALPIAGP